MSYDTKNLRNVALLGHPGSGKTSFTECMLFEAGDIQRIGTVEEKNTQSDYTNIEKERGNSIFASLTHAEWKDSKINILDTPGFDDFIGEVVSALKVADTGLMVLNAQNGVEVGTEILWDYVERFETPCLFVINQMDHEKADYEATLQQAQARFGEKVIPVQYPIESGLGFNKIVDALRMVVYVFPDGGGKPEKEPIPESEIQRAQEMHNALVEAAAENDEGLMERFFDEGTLTEEELTEGLRIAIAHQDIFPVFISSATRNMGSGRIMGFINDVCPSPADRPAAKLVGTDEKLPCNQDAETTIFVYKTMTEPQVGLVSYFKVYAGTLKAGDELINQKNQTTERFGQIFIAEGKNREQVEELRAGDIGVTVKLKNTHTNNTLDEKGTDIQIDPIHFPEPRIREAVQPTNINDMDKIYKALHQIEEEDPTFIVEQSAALKQTILHGQGQLHLDLIRYRIEKVNNVSMEFMEPRISYRETLTRKADSMFRHKKQTGGAGQFAEVHLRVEPYSEGMPDPEGLSVRNKEVLDLQWGGKLAFYWCIVGGSIDAKYANAIKKGLMQRMEEGPLTGSPCQDIRVSIYDGKMHAVDSNDMAFMLAAKQAFRQSFHEAHPQLLEPIYKVEILCSHESMGDIMGDLQTRRAIIMGMDSDGHYQKITANVPLAELYEYSNRLRSLSQGRAKFHQEFLEYQAVPHDLQADLMKAHEEEPSEA
ncbi:MAG: elongation factor G [Phaeodactylibacter sp.]|uniref:elongation factor G n=1 Tax=Phaeodactylibacter sp. TaxID=1940289 RepID=UPI0032EFD63C